jgi:hypothetical protein
MDDKAPVNRWTPRQTPKDMYAVWIARGVLAYINRHEREVHPRASKHLRLTPSAVLPTCHLKSNEVQISALKFCIFGMQSI